MEPSNGHDPKDDECSTQLGPQFLHLTMQDVARSIDAVSTGTSLDEVVALELRVVGWIRCNGDIKIGSIRYYVGNDRVTRCINIPQAVEMTLRACAGEP
jgi:hypothetical protein